jgi:hypothetical protein
VTSLVIVGFVVAVVAAVRSTWSPCGISMLSTVTPLAERSRGRRFGATAAWFVAGALGGGIGLGAVAAVGAAAVGALSFSHRVTAVVAVGATLVAAAYDAGMVRPALPHHRRQVNELWLDRYRGWVYGVGFGSQIGFGLATFIMTAAVYLTVVLAALTGRPSVALAVGAAFGLVRGLAVLAGARLTTPDALRRFHQRFEAWRAPVARWVIVAQCAVAVVIAGRQNALFGALVALVIAICVLSRLSRRSAWSAAPAGQSSGPATQSSVPTARDWTPAP